MLPWEPTCSDSVSVSGVCVCVCLQGTSSGRRLSGPPDLLSAYAHANVFEEDARSER